MEKTINFIPLDYDSFDFQDKNYIKIVGRTEDGKKACIIDDFPAYFWVILQKGLKDKQIKKLQNKIETISIKKAKRTSKVIKTELHQKNFLGKSVPALKLFITNYKDAPKITELLDFKEIDHRREFDLNIITKYIIEKKFKPMNWYKIQGELLNNSEDFGNLDASLDVDICIKANEITRSESQPDFKPKILCYDIETDNVEIGSEPILMISLYGENNFRKVLTWKSKDTTLSYVETFEDEEDMLEAFVKYVKEYSPDILSGYFSDGFDLPYLKARADKNKFKLNLGIDNSQPVFSRGRILTGKIKGIIHLDIFRFIRSIYSQYLQSETLSLNDVSSELLNEKKAEWEHKHPSKIKPIEWENYFKYNLQDSILTYKLAEKLLPDIIEFTKIIQEPLFNVSRDAMSAQVENYIMHNLEKYNEIIEKRPHAHQIGARRAEERYEGAFVLQPIPGLYEDIVFFDFTSMYGSVIVTYNLSKSTYSHKRKPDSLKVELENQKAYFSKKQGFFPQMLNEIIKKRKQCKKEYALDKNPFTKAKSNSYKLLANAAYGYQGFFGARYYQLEAAAATAALAKEKIKETIEKIKSKGHEVVYSDTDSIAFLQNKKSNKEIQELLEEINSKLPGIMELDFEGFFKRGIWVTKRTGEFGAKKKYALIDKNNNLKIRGFETVRRDWCTLARETQNKILKTILEDGNEKKAVEHVKEVIKKLKERKIPLQKLIIKTQLKKPIEEYKAQGPHVIIAKRMQEEQKIKVPIGTLIKYYISESTKKRALIRERAKLPDEKGEYDIEYYLNNQLLPAVENILEVFKINTKELVDGKKQTNLMDF